MAGMLRITIDKNAEAAAIKLEGKVAGAWVDELEHVWYSIRNDGSGKPILVDLCGVTFIDGEGKKLLRWMCGEGARFKARGCLMSETVQEIRRECDGLRQSS